MARDRSEMTYFSDNFPAPDFIRLVEQKPLLWNSSHASHGNKQLRAEAWESIAGSIVKDWLYLSDKERCASLTEIKRKWKNIKDTYQKYQKLRSKAKSIGDARKKKKYIYADLLQFLKCNGSDNFLDTEDSKTWTTQDSNCSKSDREKVETEADLHAEIDTESDIKSDKLKNETVSDSESGSSEEPPSASRNILFIDSTNEVNEGYNSDFRSKHNSPFVSSSSGNKRRLDDVSKSEDGDSEGDDPDKMFLLSMLPLFKNLSEHDKIVARIQLTQVLQKLLYPKKC